MDPQLLIERSDEVSVIGGLLDASLEGPAVALVEGAAGIGKSALHRHVVALACDRGTTVMAARPTQAESGLAFAALADLLRDVKKEVFDLLPAVQRRALRMALLLDDPTGAPIDPRTTAAALLSVLTVVAEAGPLLIAIDDAQWLDAPTGQTLAFAVRRLGTSRVALLACVRTPMNGVPLGLDSAVAPERVKRLALGPLSPAATAEIVGLRVPLTGRTDITRIVDMAEGNPLLALELAEAQRRGGPRQPGEPFPLPRDLQGLLAARVAALGAPARAVLTALAVLSRPRPDQVRALAALEPSMYASAVRELEDGRMLEVGTGGLRAAHPLYAAAADAGSKPQARRDLHRRAAGVVDDPGERARHAALSAQGPDTASAAALEVAAEAAASRGAPGTAAELFELAIQLTPAEDPQASARRSFGAARHAALAGDLVKADALLEPLVAALSPGPFRAAALRVQGLVRFRTELLGALPLFESALADAGDDLALRAATHLDVACLLTGMGRVRAAEPHAKEARRLAEVGDQSGLLAMALAVESVVAYLAGRGADLERLKRACELEDVDAAVPLLMRPRLIAGTVAVLQGDWAAARDWLLAVRAETLDRGEDAELPFLLLLLVLAALLAGDAAEAERRAHEARAVASPDDQGGLLFAEVSAVLVAAHRGDADGVRTGAARADSWLETVGHLGSREWLEACLGAADLAAGDHAAVAARVEALGLTPLDGRLDSPMLVSLLSDGVEALAAQGRSAEALALADQLAARPAQAARPWVLARLARGRALALGASGEAAAGLATALEGAALAARHDLAVEEGRCRLVAGMLARRAKRKAGARSQLEQAAALLEAGGATAWAARARAELVRVMPPAAGEELTPTEERAALLAAGGLSNRRVAAGLSISVKTVEANLARAYRKLGISTRAELGQWAATRPTNGGGGTP